MDIVFISAPLYRTKKDQDQIFPFSYSLNYGLLSLATHLVSNGYSAKIFDPGVWQDDKTILETIRWIEVHKPKYIAISCISGFSYPAMKQIVQSIRIKFPLTPIIAGGKDHIALMAKRALEECPEIDLIVLGEGESTLLEIMRNGLPALASDYLYGIRNIVSRNVEADKTEQHIEEYKNNHYDKLSRFDLTLYENFKSRPPSIEVGRGCPFGCSFCSNDRKKILKKCPDEICSEIENLSELYPAEELMLYFQTPMFLMSKSELARLGDLRALMKTSFSWRTQTRVDYLSDDKISLMYQAGARVIDLGLESGSAKPIHLKNIYQMQVGF